jgi:hypothetical protein
VGEKTEIGEGKQSKRARERLRIGRLKNKGEERTGG